LRILVAEDEPRIARDYQLILQSRGHDVTLSADGLKCLEAYTTALGKSKQHSGTLEKAPFDVVLLDYRMPKKDGLETAREIVTLCPKQRIIFASAYTRETLMESTKELHQIVELIQKPFDLSYLIEVVEDINVYNQLAQINEKVVQLKDSQLTETELTELIRIVQDGLRVAASVKITDAELVHLLKGLDNIKSSHQEAE
jgi:CheY-like chemotaxis protein